MAENGTIVTVGNPNRLVKYAVRHQNEDYFYNEDTGEIKRGGKMIFGEPWYFITPEMYPIYENGIYAGNAKLRYIGTVQLDGGALVSHVFEWVAKKEE